MDATRTAFHYPDFSHMPEPEKTVSGTKTGLPAFHYPDLSHILQPEPVEKAVATTGLPAFHYPDFSLMPQLDKKMPTAPTGPPAGDLHVPQPELMNKMDATKTGLPTFQYPDYPHMPQPEPITMMSATRTELPADDCPICHDYPGHQHSHTPQPEPIKKRLSKKDVKVLKGLFEKSQRLTESETEKIAEELGVTSAQIKNWFKTRRIRSAICDMPGKLLSHFV